MILFVVFISSCSDESISIIPQVENGNFVLFVANQSLDLNPVDIIVHIDEKLAVNREFLCKDGSNEIEFQFQLENGTHKLYSYSKKGNISKDTSFTLPATPYSTIEFMYYPKYYEDKELRKLQIFFLEHSPGSR
jgi:hypothetical protein